MARAAVRTNPNPGYTAGTRFTLWVQLHYLLRYWAKYIAPIYFDSGMLGRCPALENLSVWKKKNIAHSKTSHIVIAIASSIAYIVFLFEQRLFFLSLVWSAIRVYMRLCDAPNSPQIDRATCTAPHNDHSILSCSITLGSSFTTSTLHNDHSTPSCQSTIHFLVGSILTDFDRW
jgi:hypothetical protein